jgi:hypothetical protein
MVDALGIINKELEDHRLISENIADVNNKANDINAKVLLDWKIDDLAYSNINAEVLYIKIEGLRESIYSLRKNLSQHFILEEINLPTVLGTTLVNDLKTDHDEILVSLDKTGQKLELFNPDGISKKELRENAIEIINVVGDLSKLIEAHALKEDTLLRRKKKELENLK